MSEERLYSLKMRASEKGRHISGAERIVPSAAVGAVARALVDRALAHAKGVPDFVNVKVEAVMAPRRLAALPVKTCEARTPEEGWRIAADLLAADGVGRIPEIMALFRETYGMRGAMLLDVDTLARLEPDPVRGVRATYMDNAGRGAAVSEVKNHYAEAIVLATKVAHAPGIVGEICMSDDPDYVTGYVASRRLGYCRITCLKEKGDPAGGRIFLFRGENPAETIRYLQEEPVLVEGVTPLAAPPRRATLEEELAQIRADGLGRATRVWPDGLVNLASNDYLGLAEDPRLKAAAVAAVQAFGTGSGASRLVTGTKPPHVRLEAHLASFKGTEDALVWATGYMANVGTVSALVGRGDAVFSDELNHASIVDGCRLSRARVIVYRHNDMDDLAARIAELGPAFSGRKLAVSDAVFSMDGDVLDLPRFLDVCRSGGVMTMVDEAHSTGVLGATGRGISEHFGCGHPDVMLGTLSKALGCEGGFVATSRTVCDYLRNRSRSFIFSTAMGPGNAAAADAALTALESSPDLPRTVCAKAARFAAALREHGVAAETESAIVPVIIGDERRAAEISRALEKEGFIVPAIRYPTVAKGAARLRVGVTATVSDDDLMKLAGALGSIFRKGDAS